MNSAILECSTFGEKHAGPELSVAGTQGAVVLETVSSSKSDHSKAIPSLGSSSDTGLNKRTAIFVQDECLKHRFIRSHDTSGIFERPERLHAVKLGLAAAIARIELVESATNVQRPAIASEVASTPDGGDLVAALARMTITQTPSSKPSPPLPTGLVSIRRSSASASLLDNDAIKYVHGDIDGDVYLENLIAWARDSQKNIAEKGIEIPEEIPPLDLYLCPGSIDAIQGAIGTVCEAVDESVKATRGLQPSSTGLNDPCERAFVAIRPPGHHCGEDTPSGFCFINNVAVGAAHAHLNHGMQRIIILDIDLHHGNGTQSIVWQINEETYQQTIESGQPNTDVPPAKPGPRIFYGSLHDILSFPCEEGKPEMVQAASTSIHGPHGQYIENIHLERYTSDTQFWDVLYPHYLTLLSRARNFLDETGGPGDDVIVFISCGFDAGEHEYPSMSRHGRKVPVGFYHRFTHEACKLADVYANGRIVSVLEGGYSDRALTSGAMAHLCGLVDVSNQETATDPDGWVDHGWWSESNLIKLEKAVKPRKGASARASMEEWLARAIGLLPALNSGDAGLKTPPSRDSSVTSDLNTLASSSSMTLRERKKPVLDGGRAGAALPNPARTSKNVGRSVSTSVKSSSERTSSSGPGTRRVFSTAVPPSKLGEGGARDQGLSGGMERKKLPRVTLHVRPPDKG